MKKLILLSLLFLNINLFGQEITFVNDTECTIKKITVYSVELCGLVENTLIKTLEPKQKVTYNHIEGYEMWVNVVNLESFCSRQLSKNDCRDVEGYVKTSKYHVFTKSLPDVLLLTGDVNP